MNLFSFFSGKKTQKKAFKTGKFQEPRIERFLKSEWAAHRELELAALSNRKSDEVGIVFPTSVKFNSIP